MDDFFHGQLVLVDGVAQLAELLGPGLLGGDRVLPGHRREVGKQIGPEADGVVAGAKRRRIDSGRGRNEPRQSCPENRTRRQSPAPAGSESSRACVRRSPSAVRARAANCSLIDSSPASDRGA